jgi:hypothetical protein
MANKQVPFFRGTTTYLNTISNVDGQVLFNTTTKKIYMDNGTSRVEYNGTVDTALSTTSTNPVQNKVITGKLGTDTLTTTATTCTGAINELNTKIISADSYATCSTARSTAAKVVSLTGFSLKTGSTIKVRFTDTGSSNPASGNLTLNVNSTGAKTIVDGHSNNTTMTYANAGYFYNNVVCDFVYNGTSWVWLNRDTNTTYTGGTLKTAAAKTGSGSTVTNTVAASTTMDNAIGTLLNNDHALNSAKQPKTMSQTIAGQTTVEGCLSQLNTNLTNKCGNTDVAGYFPWYNDNTHNVGFNASNFKTDMDSYVNAIIDRNTIKLASCRGDMSSISNLNNISDGIYWINGYTAVGNKPYSEHFILISVSDLNQKVIIQTALPLMATGRKSRIYDNATWSDWRTN